jgi:hypothetical protein
MRAVSIAAATGTIIPLFTFLLFLMKIGYALIPNRITKPTLRPQFNHWSWLYPARCADRRYVLYLDHASPAPDLGDLAARVVAGFIDREQCLDELAALVLAGLIDEPHANRFAIWLHNFPDGIWDRVQPGIARCSNHAERFDGIFSARIEHERVKKLRARLAALRDVIIEANVPRVS